MPTFVLFCVYLMRRGVYFIKVPEPDTVSQKTEDVKPLFEIAFWLIKQRR